MRIILPVVKDSKNMTISTISSMIIIPKYCKSLVPWVCLFIQAFLEISLSNIYMECLILLIFLFMIKDKMISVFRISGVRI